MKVELIILCIMANCWIQARPSSRADTYVELESAQSLNDRLLEPVKEQEGEVEELKGVVFQGVGRVGGKRLRIPDIRNKIEELDYNGELWPEEFRKTWDNLTRAEKWTTLLTTNETSFVENYLVDHFRNSLKNYGIPPHDFVDQLGFLYAHSLTMDPMRYFIVQKTPTTDDITAMLVQMGVEPTETRIKVVKILTAPLP